MLKSGDLGDYIVNQPLVIGHEATAKIVDVGSNVKSLKVGDIVTLEPAIPCGNCDECRGGHYNWCGVCNKQAKGLPTTHGFLQRLYNHPASFCYKIPVGLDPKLGALSEPLAVIVHASRRGQLTVAQRVLVTGAGTMGLLALLVAKAYGAAHVVVCDVIASRLEIAKKLGADDVVHLKKGEDPMETGKKIKDTCGGPFDIIFECTGSEPCTQLAIESCRFGGKLVAVGIGPNVIQISLSVATLKEIDIIGVCRFNAGCFKLAVHLLQQLPLEAIVTHVFPLKEINEAFETMGKGEGVKIMIDCRPNSEASA